jgi:hypothetical protein
MGKWDQHALGLALLKGKELESAMLHEVVSQASLQQCPSLVEETPMTMIPTCDDDLINEFEQDFDLNHSIPVLLKSFIFFLNRS